ncbi:MAG: PAS domain S-box protein [Thermoplasmata archaeon]|nr:PAS domain S-box protein [Thermoplasmata archaeon]
MAEAQNGNAGKPERCGCQVLLETLARKFEEKNARGVIFGKIQDNGITVISLAVRDFDGVLHTLRDCGAKIEVGEKGLENLTSGKKFRISRNKIGGRFAGDPENEKILMTLEKTDAFGKVVECGDTKFCLIFLLKGDEKKIKEYLNFYAALAAHAVALIVPPDKSQNLHDIIINQIPELFVIQDTAHTVLYANLAAASYAGKKREEILGMKCYEIWHGRDTPCEICPVRDAKNSRKFATGVVAGKDGRIWYIRAQPMLDSDGEVMAILETKGDITAEEKLRKQIAALEEDYKAIVDNAVAGIYRSRLSDGLVVMANDAFARILGFEKKEDIIGKFVASKHYVDISQRIAILEKARRGLLPASTEIKLVGADGKVRVLQMHARIMKIDGEEFFEGVAVDITAKREIEESLTLSNRLLRISADINMAIASSLTLERFLNNVFVTFIKNGYDACLIFLKNEKGEIELLPPIEKTELLSELGREFLTCHPVKSAIVDGRQLHIIARYQDEKIKKFFEDANLTTGIFLPLIDKGLIHGAVFLGYSDKNAEFKSGEISELEIIAGNIGFGIGAIKDMAEKKRLEDALFESAERIRQISENISDVLCVVSEKGVIEFITPSITKLTGVGVDKLTGKYVESLLPAQDYAIIRQEALKAMALMVPITLEISVPTVWGNSVECEVSLVPFIHGKHEKKLVISIRDITDRKHTEKLAKEIEKLRIQSLMSTAVPAYTKDAPFSVYNLTMERFGKRFEETHRDEFMKFKKEMEGVKDLSDVQIYLMWLEKMLAGLSVRMKSRVDDDHMFVEFLNCPWLDEAKNYPVMCGMCRGIVIRSASWVGEVLFHEQHRSIAGGGNTCLFEVKVKGGQNLADPSDRMQNS